MIFPAKDQWSFSYDEDDFIVANHPDFDSSINDAVSNYFDDVRNIHSTEWLMSEWREIERRYPEEPNGVSFNATVATLSGAGKVTIESQYGQFETITLPESEFLCAIRAFHEFLSPARSDD
ncbi:hypothetical protein PUR34_01240 [Streptomyces sp. JV185]|uniref:hypothetical protein n=1 Tax=unclassified Streptomyces TaxID=2593676 RepID=UPI002E7A02FD|nr:hypothetical protein [Streptomyces sp. JV185]MEE1766877.1 hypothetical protein [Streptomyces sp. JV185]